MSGGTDGLDHASAIGPWTYVWRDVPRPFLHPVRTPAGHALSVDAPADHPWHHALWFTIKFVNEENFWEEYGEFGTLRQTAGPARYPNGDGALRTESLIDWVRPDGETVVLRERCLLTHRPLGDAHGLDWEIHLVPTVDVTLDRTPFTTWGGYGGLTLRGRPDWHDTELRLADGEGRERVLGERSPWLALDGPLATDGDAGGGGGESSERDVEVGVAIFDHPDNPRFPVPWYASTRAATYGAEGWSNFVNAAFLWDEPLAVAAGEDLVLRHRFLVHDGRWSTERIQAAYDTWVHRPADAPGPGGR